MPKKKCPDCGHKNDHGQCVTAGECYCDCATVIYVATLRAERDRYKIALEAIAHYHERGARLAMREIAANALGTRKIRKTTTQ